MRNTRRRSFHGATYLVAIQLPVLYLPLATVAVTRLSSVQRLFEGPHPIMDGGCRIEVLDVAAVRSDPVCLVVPTTKLLFAKAVEAARCTPCASYVTATGKCGVPLLAGHPQVLLLSLLYSS